MKSDYTQLFNDFIEDSSRSKKIDKKYSDLSVKKLELKEANKQYEEYFNRFDQKYRVLPPQSDLKRYYSLFTDINKSYFYLGRDELDLRQVGCFFLHYFPMKLYGQGHPKSKRTDYKSIFAQTLIDSKMDRELDLDLPTHLQDIDSSFVIIYITTPLTQHTIGPNFLLNFVSMRNTAQKPTLFLSLVRMPLLESSQSLEFKSFDNRSSLNPSNINTVSISTDSNYKKKESTYNNDPSYSIDSDDRIYLSNKNNYRNEDSKNNRQNNLSKKFGI